MKQVSFKVAKAIKENGYPQWQTPYVYVIKEYNIGNATVAVGEIMPNYGEDSNHICPLGEFADIPTYLDVWLWLWREKKIYIDINCIQCSEYSVDVSIWHEYGGYHYECKFTDPYEAIISAIEYLVENNLIK